MPKKRREFSSGCNANSHNNNDTKYAGFVSALNVVTPTPNSPNLDSEVVSEPGVAEENKQNKRPRKKGTSPKQQYQNRFQHNQNGKVDGELLPVPPKRHSIRVKEESKPGETELWASKQHGKSSQFQVPVSVQSKQSTTTMKRILATDGIAEANVGYVSAVAENIVHTQTNDQNNFSLSHQQKLILKKVDVPQLNEKDEIQRNKLVRITAAAGTGKTTTLLQLAQRASQLGHRHITYITFNKSAAQDVHNRIIDMNKRDPNQNNHKKNSQHTPLKIVTLSSVLSSINDNSSNGDVNGRSGIDNNKNNRDSIIMASTLHSYAMNLLCNQRKKDQIEDHCDKNNKPILNDRQMQRFIEEKCKDRVHSFLRKCFCSIDTQMSNYNNQHQQRQQHGDSVQKKESIRKTIIFYLYKTLTQFCRSNMSIKDLVDSNKFNRVYYPAIIYHKSSELFQNYNELSISSFYAETIYYLWNSVDDNSGENSRNKVNKGVCKLDEVSSFDLEMKRAQLQKLEIPGTCLLLDECQDCDACQIDWVSQQAKLDRGDGNQLPKQVFLVGDAAQTIYGFRGAKSQFMMSIATADDVSLTKSWRFGQSIARVANTILFAKEYSPQTMTISNNNKNDDSVMMVMKKKEKRVWNPYRVEGNSDINDKVTARSITNGWKKGFQITLIAWKNATLFVEAIKLLVAGDDTKSIAELPKIKMPKIHVNGRGAESGMSKFKTMELQLKELESLYMASQSSASNSEGSDRDAEDALAIALDKKIFPDFEGKEITWKQFINQVKSRELSKYAAAMGVVLLFKSNTTKAMSIFKTHVLKTKYKAEEADIILSTVHAAKGMEWDRVQVCDDFAFQMKVKKQDFGVWQFDLKDWGDDVNLLYVACTRAKKVLSIPNFILSFYRDCDVLLSNSLYTHEDDEDEEDKEKLFEPCFGIKDRGEGNNLWSQLVRKLREELLLDEEESMIKLILSKEDEVTFVSDCNTNK